ncbi:protein adenylyltransferase SelO [Vibrio intestinalis]|uniref:protein adenylyltransferase SelO n=1 Tax=Vibrio intestinalis TaxID=2933291 RepID=UPI0021A36E96|nr:YdiU family protein [Vibrio intestinalis]
MADLSSLRISHRFSQLPAAFYSHVQPQPLDNTQWIAWNGSFATEFGLPAQPPTDALKHWLAGEVTTERFNPLAMKYAGHQFGVYNPDLGDGRGLLLAELTNNQGEVFDLHLKGAGLTPYSRMGDGRAVLRSTIREYLCSEAMAGLGIATTRSLGMLSSDTPVFREKQESGALLLRMAQTHIRFGHFEHFFYTNQLAELRLLADKVIEWYWPECQNAEQPYLAMFESIVEATAKMIADWQAVGFCHGVMNTDNMSILGQTFDYGPFAFLDDYDPHYICNHSDYQGRYRFDQQPRIALWNLSALAHSLSPLIDKSLLEQGLAQYEVKLGRFFSFNMRAKLGLQTKQQGDSELFQSLFDLLQQNQTDYTRFMRQLSMLDGGERAQQAVLDLCVDRESASSWLNRYMQRCELEPTSATERCAAMRLVNPKYILRNYLAQLAIDKAEQGDFSQVHTLVTILSQPYQEQPEHSAYANLPPDWGKSMEISCSS